MTAPGSPSSTTGPALGHLIAGVLDAPIRIAAALAGAVAQRTTSSIGCGCGSSTCSGSQGGCEIPPPCWEPRPAGTCVLDLVPGTAATIRVHVSNCNWSRQVVAITALGKLAGWMTFSPTTLVLDPQERATILVTVHAPANAPLGRVFSTPIIIRGCLDHFIRVEVRIGDCVNARNCCDVCIDDCTDQIHHWYDHFYCPRPCRNVRVPGTTTGTVPGTTSGPVGVLNHG